MKKTLITLAALAMASVASAATTWTEVSPGASLTWRYTGDSTYMYDLTYSIDFMFSENSLEKGTSTIIAYANGGYTGDNVAQHTYVLSRDAEGAYTVTMGRTNVTTDVASLSYSSQGGSATQALTAGVVYTLSTSADIGGATLTWDDAEKGVQVNTRYYDDYLNYSQTGISSIEDATARTVVKVNSAYAVPEPATATLSLLALAGLAARRRRK